ncbi:PAS domain S-box protein [Aneurinibacillus sp. REN35]|uniref:PAS domain S-box protein n=1 Tax=Aneurinibacillus sp. REN35 TaxID=3237286 RepID=UPI003526F4E7
MLTQALEKLSDAIVLIDTEYNIIFINPVGEELLDIRLEDVKGHSIDDCFSKLSEYQSILSTSLRLQEERTYEILPYNWKGERKYFQCKTSLLRKDNAIIGAMSQFRNIDDYITKEKELKQIIQQMAVNIVPISEKIGVLPLQPTVTENHRSLLLERTLQDCLQIGIEKLAIDLTAIQDVNTDFADSLVKLVDALRLTGIQAVITGIQPQVSTKMIEVDSYLQEHPSFSTLSQAIDYFRKKNIW